MTEYKILQKFCIHHILRLRDDAKTRDRHYKYGSLPKNTEIELKYIIINKKKYNFLPGYFVNIRDGTIRSEYSNFGKNDHPELRYYEIDGKIKKRHFTKHHLILAAAWPDIDIDTVDHIDGNHSNNEIFNLEAVSRRENNFRAHALTDSVSAIKAGKTRSKPVLQICAKTGKIIKNYDSVKDAADDLKLNRSNLGEAANGKRNRCGGYAWKFASVTREEIDGYPRLEKEYKSLSCTRKELIKRYLNESRATPPKKVSNYGEIMDNHGRWSSGTIHRNGKYSTANEKLVHVWVMFYFHESDEDIKKWIFDDNFQILHKNGNKNDTEKYHIHTHEDGDTNKRYTNYFWTLRFGTREENRKDYITSEHGITKNNLKKQCIQGGLKVGGTLNELIARVANPTEHDIKGSGNKGYVGQRSSGKWEARKSFNGKDEYLGVWGTKELAQNAIKHFTDTGERLHIKLK